MKAVYKWADNFNMTFNGDKFRVLRYGGNEALKSQTNYNTPDEAIIKEESCVKDLGVFMSSDGSFNIHVENCINDCKKKVGWILRTFYSRDTLTMKTLFKSIILSKIDYCSLLFHSTLSMSATMKIENIQRAFTRKIFNMKDHNYWERLKKLKMSSIERRRERFIIIYMYKILQNLVPNPGIVFRHSARNGTMAVIPFNPHSLPGLIRNMKYNHFNFTGPGLFNILPIDLRNFEPNGENIVDAFKNRLDLFLSTIPDQPTTYGLQRAAASNSLKEQINYAQIQTTYRF